MPSGSGVGGLFNVPQTQEEFAEWGYIHMAHHRDINRRMYELFNVSAPEFPLDPTPFPVTDYWAFVHQQMHNFQNEVLGIQGFDLIAIPKYDKADWASWIFQNATEHLEADAKFLAPATSPGSFIQTVGGSYNFTVPAYTALTLELWGAGGGGGGAFAFDQYGNAYQGGTGSDGGHSTFLTVAAHGGTGGIGGLPTPGTYPGGLGGTGTGGDTNITGSAGQNGFFPSASQDQGGSGANGGAGGLGGNTPQAGTAPGGGGGGFTSAGGGGGGGYSKKAYGVGALTPGSVVVIGVGVGGPGGGYAIRIFPLAGKGADGAVRILWS